MICPSCRDEYRPGFTRCATCDVDLVAEIKPGQTPARPESGARPGIDADEPNVPFCGFLTLEEARQSRELLRAKGIRVAIMVSEAPDAVLTAPAVEEYWIRVAAKDYKTTVGLLGLPAVDDAGDDDSFNCSSCGAVVAADDNACPRCGLRFEE